MTSECLPLPANYSIASADYSHLLPAFESEHLQSVSSAKWDTALAAVEIETARAVSEEESDGVIRADIPSHPLYPKFIDAFVNCQKVVAPPEVDIILDQNNRGSDIGQKTSGVSICSGADLELVVFMESDLFQPFVEAFSFFSNMETQLNMLCDGTTKGYISDEAAPEENISAEEVELQHYELKDRLVRKYGGQISSLMQELSKTRKKGSLPKEAKQILLDWWNSHSHWPYPTDVEKAELAESTGLNQRQINNWFINQRKRHWKPSENMEFAVMYGLHSG